MARLIVFELDGGTWQVIDPLIAQGRLPNLSSLREQGAWGVLRSIKPMISPAVWATIYTGKTREQHGVGHYPCAPRHLCRITRPVLWRQDAVA